LYLPLTIGNKVEQETAEKESRDVEFLKWLSPSHWLIEAQFHSLSLQKGQATLQWAADMAEFAQWRTSPRNSAGRVLWIRGGPGFGKSTLSAYFIRILKQAYPTAPVAYFFCKSGQPGLTRAMDIIRTLAYQCSEGSATARSALVALQNKDFPIKKQIGVRFMCQKLLQPCLNAISRDVFVIIDGLDEMDTIKDAAARKSEMNVLVDTLGELCSATSLRLMIVSRPQTDLQQIVPDILVRTISTNDNAHDIQKYVAGKVEQSEKLKTSFRIAEVGPTEYFRKHSNGMFLWVSLVLDELLKVRSKGAFKQCLDRFASTTGDMAKLYVEILNKIEEGDRIWAKEILRWVLACQRPLSIKELKVAVESAIGDEMDDFEQFLEVQCGSFLRCIKKIEPMSWTVVQFIHETFRSVLTDIDVCPPEFFVEEQSAHDYATKICLQLACNNVLLGEGFKRYAIAYWTNHLQHARTTGDPANELLRDLHRLFNSRSLDRWLINSVLDRYSRAAIYAINVKLELEEHDLGAIVKWLKSWEVKSKGDSPSPTDILPSLETSVAWRNMVIKNPTTLCETIGKSAARMWMRGSVDEFKQNHGSFILALKYYLRRPGFQRSRRAEFDELTANRFNGLIEWAEDIASYTPKQSQFAIAFELLQKGDQALLCYQAIDPSNDELELWTALAEAHAAVGNHQEAINTYLAAFEKFPQEPTLYWMLGDAYSTVGGRDKAIELYWKGIEEGKLPQKFTCYGETPIAKAFKGAGDFAGLMRFYETAIEKGLVDPHPTGFTFCIKNLEIWRCFRNVCEARGDYPRLISRCQKELAKDASQAHLHSTLAEVYKRIGEFNNAIQEYVDHTSESALAAAAYVENGDFEGAIRFATRTYELQHKDPYSSRPLDNILLQKGDYTAMIHLHTEVAQEHPSKALVWSRLGSAHMWNGDYDAAIEITQHALSTADNRQERDLWLNLGGAYESKCDYVSALGAYSRGLETSTEKTGVFGRLEKLCFTHGFVDELTIICKSWINKNPSYNDPWTGLYHICKHTDNYTMLHTFFEEKLQQIPDYSVFSLCISIACQFKYDNKWDDGVRVYQKCAEKGPGVCDPSDSLAEAYAAKMDYDRAIKIYQTLLEEDPLGDRCRNHLGGLYLQKCEYQKAIAWYKQAIELAPTSTQAWSSLGNVYFVRGDYSQALEIYQAGAKKVEFPDVLWSAMGNIYVEQKEWDKAIIAYRAVIASQRLEDPAIWKTFRKVYSSMGDDNGIIREYQRAIDTNEFSKTLSPLWDQFHEEGMRLGQHQSLIHYYESKLQQNPYRYRLWNQLGDVYRATQQYDLAIKSYERAIKLKPTYPRLWEQLCRTYQEKGDLLGTIDAYEKAIKRNPAKPWLRKQLSTTYKAIGRYEEAAKECSVVQFPTSTLLWDSLGRVYADNGQYDKALEVLQEGIKRNPAVSWLRFVTGDVYKDMGDQKLAAKEYEMAFQGYDKSFMFCLVDSFLTHASVKGEMNDSILDAFPWRRIYPVSEESDGVKIYDNAILTYEAVLEKGGSNELLCNYEYEVPHDIFQHRHLAEEYVWVALGEAYCAKGEHNKAVGAYEKAAVCLGLGNVWLGNQLSEMRKLCERSRVNEM
jgi:tetratricopeptide (TPR) repeat protein